MGRMWPPQSVKMCPTPACRSVRATRCPPFRSAMVRVSSRSCGPGRMEPVEAEEVVGDGKHLDVTKPRLECIGAERCWTHDRAGSGGRLLRQSCRQAAEHAEAVEHALDGIPGRLERL